MKIDVQLDGRPEKAAARARELAELGVDGLFTFEGPHDVFLPLASAAGAVDADLMTNVAIALPRSPMHLAHTAYPAAHREAVRCRVVTPGRPDAGDRSRGEGDLRCVGR